MKRLILIMACIVWSESVGGERPEENEVLGHPAVVCAQEGVRFEMETKSPFEGQLYVRDEFQNDNCRASFGGQNRTRRAVTHGSFKLRFTECGMRRQRMVTPDRGIAYTVTMMVQFHPTFVTQNDRAYQLRCFYREQNTKVQSQDISVSPLETEMMLFEYPMPKCTYEIRLGTSAGVPANYVRIGDMVVHSFKCDEDEGTYRMLVKDCFIDDGKNNSQRLITSSGCSVDETLFQTPQYSSNSLEAQSEAKVFKWPDEPAVYFSCQLTLCIAADEECNRLTPPLCGSPPKARHRRSPRLEKSASSLTTRSRSLSVPVRGAVDFDLEARRLIVLPADAVINGDAKSKPMNIAVEAQIFHPESSEDATESTAKPSTTESQAEEETTVSEPAIFTTRKWSSAIGQARPVGVSPHAPSPHIPPHVPSSGALGDGAAPASKRGRHCYGPEYAVGFAFLLTFFCLLLGAFTLRLCCPMVRDVAQKHCGLTLTWDRQIDSRSSSSSSSGDGVYSTIGVPKVTAVAVDPYVGGVYFGK